ncbi:hypothetical protein ACOMHN_013327 [Nucella lapillus]
MSRLSRVSSKSEAHARVRCRGEENKLSCIKHELDKVLHVHSRVLGTSRTRFILDRRRSLNNVYNSQTEGIQPHLRIRHRRRDSAPEVFEIFRRQADRRWSIKIMERTLSEDAVSKLDREHQDALGRHRSDIDEEDALLAPNIDIEGPDYEEGETNHGKMRKRGDKPGEADREKARKERKEDKRGKDWVKLSKKEIEPDEGHQGKMTGEKEEGQEEKDQRKTRRKGDEEDAKGHSKLRKNEDEKEEKIPNKTAKKEREEERKVHVERKEKEREERRKDDEKTKKKESNNGGTDYGEGKRSGTEQEKNDYKRTDRVKDEKDHKKTENAKDQTDSKKTTKPGIKKDEKDYKKSKKSGSDKDDTDDKKAKRKGREKDEKDDDKKKKKEKEKDRGRPHKTKAESSEFSPSPSKTSSTGHTHTCPQPQGKGTHAPRKDIRYEDRNDLETDNHRHTREDSTSRGINPHHSTVAKRMPSSPVEARKIPQRKRSHSDGNIFMNLLELEDTLRQTYELSKAAAEAAAEAAAAEAARSDEDDSEDDGRMLFRGQAWVQTGGGDYSPSHSYSEMSDNEPSGVDLEASRPTPWLRQRRVGQVSLEFSALENADVKWQMHEHDVTARFQNGRRGSYPHSEQIRLSPSLQRRLANVSQSPRHHQDLGDDVNYSPSMTRRRADISCSPSMLRHQADVSYFPPMRRLGVSTNDRDSPTRWRKDDKPKPIYQQGEAEKASKRRPLRRSRSEAIDVSALVTEREKHGLGVNIPRAGRRGSDSIQDLSTARMGRNLPRGWNSLLLGLALTQEEKEDIARHKRKELVTSLRKRQEEVDSDVSRRIQTFLQRYDDA